MRFVALFADYSAVATAHQQRAPGASVVPSDQSIDWALRAAHDETAHLAADDRRLDVALLRADAANSSLKLGVVARHYIDQLRLNAATSQTVRVQLWHVNDVAIDVLDHVDVPTHRLATDAERRRFSADELPLLLLDDAAARWHGFAIDDVVAIERDDADTGRCVVLHCVVERPAPRGQRVAHDIIATK